MRQRKKERKKERERSKKTGETPILLITKSTGKLGNWVTNLIGQLDNWSIGKLENW